MAERTPAVAQPLKVLSTLAVKGAMPALEAGFLADGGVHLEITFAPTNGLVDAIASGAGGDVAILTREGASPLVAKGRLLSPVDIAHSYVGLAVAAGAPRPDISTPQTLVATLQAARKVAYSKIGASGIYFAGLIERLGIAEEIKAKAIVVSGGFTGQEVASGRADVAIQQVSELKIVPGISVVGALPKVLQDPVVFSASLFAASPRPEIARGFIRYLAGTQAACLLTESGLEPLA